MNRRLFVEKKPEFNVEANSLAKDLRENFKLINLSGVQVINIYDIFNISEAEYLQALNIVFSEINVDAIYETCDFGIERWFAIEYLPGQYDKRADSAEQCLKLLSNNNDDVVVKTGKLIVLNGDISLEDLTKVKKYYINSIEMREKNLDVLRQEINRENNQAIPEYNDFTKLNETKLEAFRQELGLAMTLADLEHIQAYFINEEKRSPTETEIKVLDTYWSDHCRHTTFETKITAVDLAVGKYQQIFDRVFNNYLTSRELVLEEKSKPITLMDMATINAKELKTRGELSDLEISEEINACSIFVDVDVDDKLEKWLIQFKNETHNHPTEIEPFGGASTCLGGAIRDPLSGRTYVYQAVRVSGAANPLETVAETLPGKLSQKTITTKAAHGFSSYGNQIGLATTHVAEIYDSGYKAKRMEVGMVVGAAPANYIRRESPAVGNIVILLGGKTGRDGCGGATGSSKEHNIDSAELCSAEVQKGNPIVERKIQRLFRNLEVTKLIKKCNDFGAGGVSVAIGELADSLEINLNKIPVKYIGLTGTELAISESQERMAVVIAAKDCEQFIKFANLENLEATVVASVTNSGRLIMKWNGQTIVNLSRNFLNTNGASSEAQIKITPLSQNEPFNYQVKGSNLLEKFKVMLQNKNVCSQKGLVENFDATIGATTVLMPFGGKYQLTPTEVSVQKIPLLKGITDTATMVAFGYNPRIFKWSPFHGAINAILESVAKVVAAGGRYNDIKFTFQEYFEKLGTDPYKWGKPFAALLGAYHALQQFNLAAIGGKDSMSGTFGELNVPPTLISFAIAPVKASQVISPEFKASGNYVYLITHPVDEYFMPDFNIIKQNYAFIHEHIINSKFISAMSVKFAGIAETIAKMCFGNKMGFAFESDKDLEDELFKFNYGAIIVESKVLIDYKYAQLLGKTQQIECISYQRQQLNLETLINYWQSKLETVFPTNIEYEIDEYSAFNTAMDNIPATKTVSIAKASANFAKPKVIIPIFPGTNCEYDSLRAFDRAGANANTLIFNNLSQQHISQSIQELSRQISDSQILMLAGGFSAGDEPDGSAKFIATILRNSIISDAINKLLERDGLILGICNGFQALIKSGLLPYGKICKLTQDSPTLTFNTINRHISQIVPTKITNNTSPWLNSMAKDEIYNIAMSHGEGRFMVTEEFGLDLFASGQVATQYVDLLGKPTLDLRFNPNGSNFAIEGLTSPDGKIFGKMGHSERIGINLYKNVLGNKEQNIFANGVNYFK